jgi:hypothetical protein
LAQIENIVFDPTYYLLAMALTFVLLYTAALALRLRKRLNTTADRDRALGTSLTAVGALVANTGAVLLTAMLRGGLIGGVPYLQAEFLIVYAGFGAVLYGIEEILSATSASDSSIRWPRSKTELRVLLSSAYALAVGFSAVYLLNPATYMISNSGATQHAAQQTVFWLPAFLTLSVGIVLLLPAALKSEEVDVRKHAIWFVLCATLVLIGLLRESTVIPSSGDPLVDLLVAFVPFTVGGFSLYQSSRVLRVRASSVTPVDFSAGPASLRYFAVHPRSIGNAIPVIAEASSEQR